MTPPPVTVHWPTADETELHVGDARVVDFTLKGVEPGETIEGTVEAEWFIEWVTGPVVLGWNGAD